MEVFTDVITIIITTVTIMVMEYNNIIRTDRTTVSVRVLAVRRLRIRSVNRSSGEDGEGGGG